MEHLIQLKVLVTEDGKAPFAEWYRSLRDKTTRVRVVTRLDRLILGNFGDYNDETQRYERDFER